MDRTDPVLGEADLDLNLSGNALIGPVPAWFGDVAGLRSLNVSGNPLTGWLPQALTQLERLEALDFSETASVCAPGDAAFETWLTSLDRWEGEWCDGRRRWPRVR